MVNKGAVLEFYDLGELMGLPLEEFAERCHGEMTRYFYEHARERLKEESDWMNLKGKEER